MRLMRDSPLPSKAVRKLKAEIKLELEYIRGNPMKSRVHYTKPFITELELEYATNAARNGWGCDCYKLVVTTTTSKTL